MHFSQKTLLHTKLEYFYSLFVAPPDDRRKMLVLLRQGRISKWFSGIGQEAIAVGAALALEKDEWILPLHRNLGVFTTRGIAAAINCLCNGRAPKKDLAKAGREAFILERLNIISAA